tara:strand:- start:11049 stop:12857 length:1809 start_codon:yes stop_codon:yes gene_type:complete
MCGILGTINFKTETSLIKKSLSNMAHRGPDDSGISKCDDGVFFGHNRLSIIDLSENGRQPFISNCSNYTIAFNGEIYNYIELREELKKHGIFFKTSTDTEVLLEAYKFWGKECIRKLNGMWAILIWDNLKKQLFVSRDRLGQKPLFYAEIEGGYVFASEMKGIIPFLKEVIPSKNFHILQKNITHYESTKDCLISGIYRFPSSTNGIIKKNGKLEMSTYWNALEPSYRKTSRNYSEEVEEFNALLEDSCRLRLRCDVNVGTTLSGGLDSSSILAHNVLLSKKEKSKNGIEAFTASFKGSEIDESNYAADVINYLNVKGNFLDINPLENWDNIIDSIYLTEDIYLTCPIPMLEIYKKIKSSGITVSIDGHGADELFGGYFFSVQDLSLNGLTSFRTLKNVKDISYDSYASLFSQMPQKAFNRIAKRDLVGRYESLIDNDNFNKLDYFNKILYIQTHKTILPTLLRNYDRYSMASGVEVRMPFLDYRMVEFAFQIGYNSKIRNGYTKTIVRDSMRGLIPDNVIERKDKIGFNSPMTNWMKNDLKEYFLDTISSQSFLNSSLINPKEVKKIISDTIFKPYSYRLGEEAWSKFSPYLWEQAFINKK